VQIEQNQGIKDSVCSIEHMDRIAIKRRTPKERLGRGSRVLAAALMVSALPFGTASGQTASSTEEQRILAFKLVSQGKITSAETVAQALLASDPGDAMALIILSRIRRASNDLTGAQDYARKAWQSAATPEQKFGAAMEMARTGNDLDRPVVAQFWLRRAAQNAPTPELKAQTVRSFRQLRADNPWRFSFQFSVAPSSNVNNGSSEDTIDIGGLPFTLNAVARSLSGILSIVGGTARYRFDGVNGRPASFTFSGTYRDVTLSSDAKRSAPDVTGSDYDYAAVELQYGQILHAPGASPALRGDISLGRNWYGGEPLSNYARVGLTAAWSQRKTSATTLSFSIEDQARLDLDARSATILRLNAARLWTAPDGGTLTLSAGLRHTSADAVEVDHKAGLVGLSYGMARPIAGAVSVKFSLGVEQRLYDRSVFSTDGRRDLRLQGGVTFGFDTLEYYGFAPQLTLSATRVNSNIALYDRQDAAVFISLRSVF